MLRFNRNTMLLNKYILYIPIGSISNNNIESIDRVFIKITHC